MIFQLWDTTILHCTHSITATVIGTLNHVRTHTIAKYHIFLLHTTNKSLNAFNGIILYLFQLSTFQTFTHLCWNVDSISLQHTINVTTWHLLLTRLEKERNQQKCLSASPFSLTNEVKQLYRQWTNVDNDSSTYQIKTS